MQTSAAKIVLDVGKRSSSTAALRELHWLPVSHRIDYKVSLLTFKTLTTSEPKYLHGLQVFEMHVAARSWHLLHVTLASHSLPSADILTSQAFCFHASSLWNALPTSLSAVRPFTPVILWTAFKRNLKKQYFSSAFNLACQTV